MARDISSLTPVTPVIWAVDVGSVKRKRFAWCRIRREERDSVVKDGDDILDLVKRLADDLSARRSVALGFECPLFVPVPKDPFFLTSAREGENNHPWSAGAGCAALATGLSETAWIFERTREFVNVDVQASFVWHDFIAGKANLFIWEALVTGPAKGQSHREDARAAATSFLTKYPDVVEADAVERGSDKPFYSLVGAALLRSGLTRDVSILRQKCIVIRS
ncbi:MAG: hypothetical protein Q7R50_01110 [Dehalococcoidales bacterium]|nr:hypothetical protein [Dehalococcoidales bacterium]